MRKLFSLHPNTIRQIKRFSKIRRAKYSLFIIILIFVISLLSEFIANDKPLIVRCNKKLYFPFLNFYPESVFTNSSINTRPRYKELEKKDIFSKNKNNWMLWPIIKYGPKESLTEDQISINTNFSLSISSEDKIGTIDVDSKLRVRRSNEADSFTNNNSNIRGEFLNKVNIDIPNEIIVEIKNRFKNKPSKAISKINNNGITFNLKVFEPSVKSKKPPKLIRINLNKRSTISGKWKSNINKNLKWESKPPYIWNKFNNKEKELILNYVKESFLETKEKFFLSASIGNFIIESKHEVIEFPFRPTSDHWFGLDNSGRDVGVRILYATRTSLVFGIILVIVTYIIGIILGAIQGYFGGAIDIISQRLIEIWESMPFLIIIILISSIYGKSFILLTIIYSIFNWIGISYYIRAEFLKLRKQPFVEASKSMGINNLRIMFYHILPNSLIPIITFFPFSLVGSIFILTSLDYLGFGLPPGTPSWGNLLDQGQTYQYAWWLILYPSIALFLISLLGIFIGEGIRAGFDPKIQSKNK